MHLLKSAQVSSCAFWESVRFGNMHFLRQNLSKTSPVGQVHLLRLYNVHVAEIIGTLTQSAHF